MMKTTKLASLMSISAVAILALAGCTASSAPKAELLDEIDVNGITISEACEAVRDAGWRVQEVEGQGDRTEKSDCSDAERKVVSAWFVNVDEEDYESLAGTVTLKFANEKSGTDDAPETEPAAEETAEPAEPAAEESASAGYQAIYDTYAARLQNECPSLALTECAELSNEGVSEMAKYMYSASGTDGQMATYTEWAGKLMDVYMASAL